MAGLYGSRERAEEMVVTQRAMLIGYYLACGERLTTARIAEITGITPNGAHKMLEKGSAALPIIFDEIDGVWELLAE